MNLVPKYFSSLGGVATAALLLALTAPSTALAASVAPVQDPDMATAPTLPSAASDIITIVGGTTAGTFRPFHLLLQAGDTALASYVVPTGKVLVITSVEITPNQSDPSATGARVQVQGSVSPGFAKWLVSTSITSEFQYPTGFVIGSSVVPMVFSDMYCDVTLHGYLAPSQ
jgi:hypothetical protein